MKYFGLCFLSSVHQLAGLVVPSMQQVEWTRQSRTSDNWWLTPGFPSVPDFCLQPVFCSCCRCAPVRWSTVCHLQSDTAAMVWNVKLVHPKKLCRVWMLTKLEWISPSPLSYFSLSSSGTCKKINAISLTVCQFKAVCCDSVRCI